MQIGTFLHLLDISTREYFFLGTCAIQNAYEDILLTQRYIIEQLVELRKNNCCNATVTPPHLLVIDFLFIMIIIIIISLNSNV